MTATIQNVPMPPWNRNWPACASAAIPAMPNANSVLRVPGAPYANTYADHPTSSRIAQAANGLKSSSALICPTDIGSPFNKRAHGFQSPSMVTATLGSSTKYVSPRSPVSAGSNTVGVGGRNHQGLDRDMTPYDASARHTRTGNENIASRYGPATREMPVSRSAMCVGVTTLPGTTVP